MTKEVIKATKLVNVYNSANNSLKEINIPTEVNNRAELVKYLSEHNIDYSSTTMMIAETDLVLATDNSVIPNEDFTLVLTPKNVKSGLDIPNASYKEMKEFIKKEVQENKEKVKQHFGNYTQLSTDRMRQLLLSYTHTEIISSVSKPTIIEEKSISSNSIIDKAKALANKFIEDINNLFGQERKEVKQQTQAVIPLRTPEQIAKEKEEEEREEKRRNLQNKYGDVKLDI